MGRNIEIKAKIHDWQKQLALADSLKTEPIAELHQHDTFYIVPSGRLKLRVFPNNIGELIQYYRDDVSDAKRSNYTIFRTDDPETLHRTLADSIGVRGQVIKSRALVMIDQTRVHFDRVEGLGEFMELEVVLHDDQSDSEGTTIADALIEALEVRPQDLLECAYIDLLENASSSNAT
ncbi:MAG: putative adenylyl cyclase CyaB [Pirellulaceae bacterium]|jgi:predicted adenylyl cyclase CyaB